MREHDVQIVDNEAFEDAINALVAGLCCPAPFDFAQQEDISCACPATEDNNLTCAACWREYLLAK